MGFLSRLLKKKPERVREAQFAGHLYPASGEELGERLERALGDVKPPQHPGKLRALIVPFAQLDYIEAILVNCWGLVRREEIARVALVGSALRIPFHGVAMSTAQAWRSPLGASWLDEVWSEQLQSLELVRGIDAIHEHEPSLELQLPFIQRVLEEDATIMPLLMGDGSTTQMLHILKVLAAREQSLLVVATEIAYGMTHEEGDAEIARVIDAIQKLDPDALTRGSVTARHPVRALLSLAREEQWQVTALGHTTSREEQERREEQLVVQDQGLMAGYAGFALYEPAR